MELSIAYRLYESPPWGFQHENNFINQAVELNTVLQPNEILKNCLEIGAKTRAGKESVLMTIKQGLLILIFFFLILKQLILEI